MTKDRAMPRELAKAVLGPPRVVITRQEWQVVTGPILCVCGHVHFGRVDRNGSPHQPPQWRWCEDPSCGCFGLRTATS